MRVLVTGVAGFIGFNVARQLLRRDDEVFGIDCISDYYDPGLKRARLAQIQGNTNFRFIEMDLLETKRLSYTWKEIQPEAVIHLAAQPGVRYSIENPRAYLDNNLAAFLNILEACREVTPRHLIYASSSSVYGGNKKMPFSESDSVDHPVSLYAATKKANELMAHTYSHLFGIPTTGLRFFTVYGPWGRPDMAPFLVTKAILSGEPIKVYNHGNLKRDFTFIDDIVDGVIRVVDKPSVPNEAFDSWNPDSGTSNAPYRVFNIGNHTPVPLMEFIAEIEEAIGKKADMQFLPMQPGDVYATYANVDALDAWVGFKPSTPLKKGIGEFVRWYRSFYKV